MQVVLPLNVETIIPEDDSVRTLMRIAERINYTKLSGAYERVSPREATPKQLFLLVVLGHMEERYSTRENEKACRTDTRFMWILREKPAPDHTRISRFLQRISGEILEDLFYQVVHLLHEDGEIAYEHLFVDGTKFEANAGRYTFVWRKRVEKGMAKLAEKQKKRTEELGTRYAFELGNSKKPEGMLFQLQKLAQKQEIIFVHGSGKRKTQLQRD
ncbi:MAG: transposase, partial [Clostridia bacterium]|nr:transposase [Clostridia bacterium]